MNETSKTFPALVDTALAIEKRRVALQTRSTHLAKQGRVDEDADDVLQKVQELEDYVDNKVANLLKQHSAYHWFSLVKGVGNENIAKVVGLIDIEKAPTVSSLWKFAGFHVENGKAPRPTPGQKLPYNSKLRTMCWRLGSSLNRAGIRQKCSKCKNLYGSTHEECPKCGNTESSTVATSKFSEYYLQEKAKYTNRFKSEGYTIVPADKLPKVSGKKTETGDFISDGHIHNMAVRKMIKMFLSMLWVTWREAEGLPTNEPYSVAIQGHSHIRTPDEWTDKLKKVKKNA